MHYCGKIMWDISRNICEECENTVKEFEKFDHAKQIDDSRRLVKKVIGNERTEKPCVK